jgi:hypothetical protein
MDVADRHSTIINCSRRVFTLPYISPPAVGTVSHWRVVGAPWPMHWRAGCRWLSQRVGSKRGGTMRNEMVSDDLVCFQLGCLGTSVFTTACSQTPHPTSPSPSTHPPGVK